VRTRSWSSCLGPTKLLVQKRNIAFTPGVWSVEWKGGPLPPRRLWRRAKGFSDSQPRFSCKNGQVFAIRWGRARERQLAIQGGKRPPEEVLDALAEAAEDDDVLDKVNGYTRKRLLELGLPAEDVNVEELVQDAFSDTAGGVRTWNPNGVSVVTHLCGVVKNHTREVVRKAAQAPKDPLPDDEAEGGNKPLSSPVDEEERLGVRELLEHGRRLLSGMAKESADEQVEALLTAFELEITGPTEIAEMTGMTVPEVNNAKKRLKDLQKRLPEELRQGAKGQLGSPE
jgi:DNA-directed RNA polymerase specialized sigma24 family protein